MGFSAVVPCNSSMISRKVVQPHVAVHTKYGSFVTSKTLKSSHLEFAGFSIEKIKFVPHLILA
jgi:hypothetical protein